MTNRFDFDKWVGSLRVVRDEALLPDEPKRRPWRHLTDEERRHYKRDWMRQYRARQRQDAIRIVASLHDLRCTGPTRSTGCRCHKVTIYERVESAA